MATDMMGKRPGDAGVASQNANASIDKLGAVVVQALASLKLTVGLLAISVVIVLIGTLAQARKDMWDVIADYFDSWIALVYLTDLLPPAWFPQGIFGWEPPPKWCFPFFGGKLIGCAMFVNLISAHCVRFKKQARGQKLGIGLALIAVGAVLTTLVIVSGHNHEGLQGKPPFSWAALWTMIRIGLVATAAGTGFLLYKLPATKRVERQLTWAGAGLLGLLLVAVFWPGADDFLGDAGMRILWQLLQATFAGGLLLVGCMVVFGRRGGVVLLHGGIGLLMFGQLMVSMFAVEERMTIREGETVNYVQDIRAVELAIVDPSGADADEVVAIPITEKGKATPYGEAKSKAAAADLKLPFDVEVVEFYKNSGSLRRPEKEDKNPATAGIGLTYIVDPVAQNTGASSAGGVDVAAAYVKFSDAASGADLGTYLFSQVLSEQNHAEKIKVGDKTYEATLRFKRAYKPYSISLKDVRKDDYPGTTIPKNYSSDIQLSDPSREFDDAIHIRMNEPLRYAGETFYQSGYRVDEDGVEVTDLQVVTNTGWMIPYVACMLVVIGMLAHFCLVLARFLERTARPAPAGADVATAAVTAELADAAPRGERKKERRKGRDREAQIATAEGSDVGGADRFLAKSTWLIAPCVVAAGIAVVFSGMARRPMVTTDGFDLARFGSLPVLEKGRVKPLDTLARNTMRVISNRETFKDAEGKSQPAIRWFIDAITDREFTVSVRDEKTGKVREEKTSANDYRIFRIENDDVLHMLGLERRPGLRYSVEELMPKIGEFEKACDEARQRKTEDLSVKERKLLELDGRIRAFTLVKASFSPLNLPPLPTEEEFNANPEAAKRRIDQLRRFIMQIPQMDKELARMQPPRAIPFKREDGEWQAYSTAANFDYLQRTIGNKQEGDEAVATFTQILQAYFEEKPGEFNGKIDAYESLLRRKSPEMYRPAVTKAELSFNRLAPFSISTYLYVLAFALTAASWLLWLFRKSEGVNRVAFWIVVCTLVVHTAALTARVVISGRPPVTNLYSSAVFIGWGCVIFGVALEAILKRGIGNIVASSAGFVTLVIADKLAMDGETMAVMQAVLDTQFWLSTHVVCITLGYSATYVAGLLGIVYLFGRLAPGVIDAPIARYQGSPLSLGKALGMMTYGVVCFAIFFSFWGTVLGGLWADDSWGRFWGWDPKENGALIIVLWNALVLHALWDRMVGDRGLAMLAVGGNIVTSWSWFGVNELGVGLHSYGFTEGVLFTLGMVVLVHLGIMALGFIPAATRGKDDSNVVEASVSA
ncbi:MAG: cytochrome c biogenesis protein CcsA [Pirellulales bacterium]